MTQTKRLLGGMLWTKKETGVPGWESDGEFTILEDVRRGTVVLVATEHDPLPGDDCEFWRKRFSSVTEAMEYAERM